MRDWPPEVRPRYQQAIFFDRDGTINVDTHYPHNVNELILVPGALEGICLLSRLDFHLIVVSNQGGIPLNLFTIEQMTEFNAGIRQHVEAAGGRLDAFYYSPYLEQKNLSPGDQAHFSSKPNPGMLLEAAGDFGVNLVNSFIIGDKSSDVIAGHRVGCTTILVLTGKAGKEQGATPCQPDYVVADLYAAAILIQELLTD